MIPAFIYFVNNNVVFFILKLVDPVTFQLLSQLKTIFTGLLFRLFLQRRLSAIQYTALITLACGTATWFATGLAWSLSTSTFFASGPPQLLPV